MRRGYRLQPRRLGVGTGLTELAGKKNDQQKTGRFFERPVFY